MMKMVATRQECTSGAWWTSPYSSENASTRQNRGFLLAKLALAVRSTCGAQHQAGTPLIIEDLAQSESAWQQRPMASASRRDVLREGTGAGR